MAMEETVLMQNRNQKPEDARFSVFNIVFWAVPLVMLAGGRFLPGLHKAISDYSVWSTPASTVAIVVVGAAAAVWVFLDFVRISDRETTSKELHANLIVSTAFALVLTWLSGWLSAGDSKLEWWFVIPWVMTVADLFGTGWAAINNATQKPYFSARGTR